MPYFVRVKDKSTKHQFDVPETDPRIGKTFTLVNSDRYPRCLLYTSDAADERG